MNLELVEKKAAAKVESEAAAEGNSYSETFEEWEQIFEKETFEMEKSSIVFNDFVENPQVDILMDEEKEALKQQEDELQNELNQAPLDMSDANWVMPAPGQDFISPEQQEELAWENETVFESVVTVSDNGSVQTTQEAENNTVEKEEEKENTQAENKTEEEATQAENKSEDEAQTENS